jgi:hypothetical protein
VIRKVLILGAGGPAGIGMTRCLNGEFNVYGQDDSEWGSLAQEARPSQDESHDIVIPVADSLVKQLSWQQRSAFLPPQSHIMLCEDKAYTARVLGGLAPKTYWERDTKGAGAQGAKMISEYLPGRNFSVELVMDRGEVVAYFQKERLSYLVKRKEMMPTGLGTSAVSVCLDEPRLLDAAISAIRIIEESTGEKSHGFYGVDLREDENEEPKVTEINAGRLLTASYSYFYLTGYNLPLVGMKVHLGESWSLPQYPKGYGMIRQIDHHPLLVNPSEAKHWL